MIERPVDFIAKAEGETETAECSYVERDVWGAPGSVVGAEIVAVDRVTVDFRSVVQLDVLAQAFSPP